jgi:hypothetical protein
MGLQLLKFQAAVAASRHVLSPLRGKCDALKQK